MWYLFNHFSIQKQNIFETYHVWTTRTRMNRQIPITTRFWNKVQHNVYVDMVRESLFLVVWRAPICSRCYFSSWFCNWHGSRKIMLRLALWGPICIFHIWILLAKHIKATRKLENEDSEQIIFYALMLKAKTWKNEDGSRKSRFGGFYILTAHSSEKQNGVAWLGYYFWIYLAGTGTEPNTAWRLAYSQPPEDCRNFLSPEKHDLHSALHQWGRRPPDLPGRSCTPSPVTTIPGARWPMEWPGLTNTARPRLGTGPTYNLMFLELLCPELLMCHVTITPHWASQTPAATGSTLAQCCVLEYQCSQFNTESTSVYVFPVYLLKENKNTREIETLTKWKREISVQSIKRGNISSCYASAPIWNIFKKTHRWNCQDLTLGERFLCL